jgi:hypothetical protein
MHAESSFFSSVLQGINELTHGMCKIAGVNHLRIRDTVAPLTGHAFLA